MFIFNVFCLVHSVCFIIIIIFFIQMFAFSFSPLSELLVLELRQWMCMFVNWFDEVKTYNQGLYMLCGVCRS